MEKPLPVPETEKKYSAVWRKRSTYIDCITLSFDICIIAEITDVISC